MKLVSLISGGIDSPVAAFLMLRRGFCITLLHMSQQPFTDGSNVQKVRDVARRLMEFGSDRIEVYVAPFGEGQSHIAENCDDGFQCILCKMLMLKIAERFARKIGAEGIVTGDSLGQVASQTLHNISVEQHDISLPILRPLIGFDKMEIERIAKSIGTYSISIRQAMTCPFVPRRPITKGDLKSALQQATKIQIDLLANQISLKITKLEF